MVNSIFSWANLKEVLNVILQFWWWSWDIISAFFFLFLSCMFNIWPFLWPYKCVLKNWEFCWCHYVKHYYRIFRYCTNFAGLILTSICPLIRTVHHKNYAHRLCFVVFCSGLLWADFTSDLQGYFTATDKLWRKWVNGSYKCVMITTNDKQNHMHVWWDIKYHR